MPRWSKILIGVVVGLAALGGIYFLADGIVRSIAEERIATEIAKGLPETVDGTFDVTIGGTSVIAQYLTGTFEHVELTDDTLTFDGTTVAVALVANGIPTNLEQPVDYLSGTIVLDQSAVDRLWQQSGQSGQSGQGGAGTSLTLGKGTVAYDGEFSLLGLSVGYQVTALPEAADDRVMLHPKDAALTGSFGSLDLSGLLDTVLQGEPIELCVAQYLPRGIDLTSIVVAPDSATIQLTAKQFVISENALKQTGSCAP